MHSNPGNYYEDEPPAKLKRETSNVNLDTTYVARNNNNNNNFINNVEYNEEMKELKDKIENIKSEIECKNTQINEIQQMVIEGDQGMA